jgi:predicted nucleic acid-binding protein
VEAAGSTVIVVDTNVVARFVLRGDGATLAERILERDSSWVAPPLVHSELRNVLATSMRARRMTLEEALAAVSVADKVLAGRPREVDTGSVLELAERSGCTSYDCEFVSVALDLGVPLVTSDRQVLAAFPETAVSPGAFVSR